MGSFERRVLDGLRSRLGTEPGEQSSGEPGWLSAGGSASESIWVDGGDVGVVFEAGDLVVEGGEAVDGGGVFESPEGSLVTGDAELFGLLVEPVDVVDEFLFDGPDDLVPALPSRSEVGAELVGQAERACVAGGG